MAVLAILGAENVIGRFCAGGDAAPLRMTGIALRWRALKYGADVAAFAVDTEVRAVESERSGEMIEIGRKRRLTQRRARQCSEQDEQRCESSHHYGVLRSEKDVDEWHSAQSLPNSPR